MFIIYHLSLITISLLLLLFINFLCLMIFYSSNCSWLSVLYNVISAYMIFLYKLPLKMISVNFYPFLLTEFVIKVCYGTTETSPVSFMSIRDDPPEQRIKSVGHIMDHLEVHYNCSY